MEEDNKLEEDSFSLKLNCKNRVKSLFDQLRRDNKNVMSYLLIVDEQSIKMISSYLKRMELMELDILAIEQLEFERKPYQKQHTIYFITPTQESVDRLLGDFPNKKDNLYGYAHVFFTNQISPHLMKSISSNQFLMERLKTFKEFNQDFMCKFDNIFNFNLPKALPTLFSAQGVEKDSMIKLVGDKLSTVILSMEKFYGIEIIYNRESNKVSEQLALVVNNRIKEVVSALQQKDDQEILDKEAGKVTLIIIDRSYDAMTPLVRDFHYRPMLYDLKNIENDLVNYESETETGQISKERAILSDQQDNLFPRYQFRHIAEVMEGIPEEFQEFAQNNTTAQVQKGELKDLDFNTMSEVIKKMPKYRQLLSKYTMHIKLIQDCWQIFEQKDLSTLGELEQTLATGLDQFGKEVSTKKLLSQIGSRLISSELTEMDKQRLVLLAIICLDVIEKDRQFLTNKISLEGQQAILNLKWLGISPQSSGGSKKKSKSKGKLDKKLKKNIISKMQSQTLSLCRHTPAIEQLVSDLISQNDLDGCFDSGLPIGKFSSIKINMEEKLGRLNKKPKKRFGKGANLFDDNENDAISTPKVILFIAGGISQSEIRCIRNLKNSSNQNVGIIVGGSTIMNPNDYVQGLTNMKSSLNF